jgi:hypothetical protein
LLCDFLFFLSFLLFEQRPDLFYFYFYCFDICSYDGYGYEQPSVEAVRGLCVLGGLVRTSTRDNIIAVLPTHCRPTNRLHFIVLGDGGAAVGVDVLSDGQLIQTSTHNKPTEWISLSGVVYAAHPHAGVTLIAEIAPAWHSVDGPVTAHVIDSMCILEGQVEVSTVDAGANLVIGTLPVGCRPTSRMTFAVAMGFQPIVVDVIADGTISLLSSFPSTNPAAPLRLSLASILFPVQQPNALESPSLEVLFANIAQTPAGVQFSSIQVDSPGTYRLTVRARKNGNSTVHLWVRDDTTGRNIVWPGPRLVRASRNIVSVFTVPAHTSAITFGFVFRGVNPGENFVIESLPELLKLPNNIHITNGSNSNHGQTTGASSASTTAVTTTHCGLVEWWGYNYAGGCHWQSLGGVKMADHKSLDLPSPAHVDVTRPKATPPPYQALVVDAVDASGGFAVCGHDNSGLGLPLGLQSGSIRDWQLTASSEDLTTRARFARLQQQPIRTVVEGASNGWSRATSQNEYGGWTPAQSRGPLFTGEWLEIDLEHVYNLTAIDTQGLSGLDRVWTSSYRVVYSTNGVLWTPVLTVAGEEQLFTGNHNSFAVATNLFNPPLTARYVRVYPMTWTGALQPGLRVELHGCDSTVAPARSPSPSPSILPSLQSQSVAGCPRDCSGHGECVIQTCVCSSNELGPYSGTDCSIAPKDLRFQDVSFLLKDNPVRMGGGLAVVDVDGDGEVNTRNGIFTFCKLCRSFCWHNVVPLLIFAFLFLLFFHIYIYFNNQSEIFVTSTRSSNVVLKWKQGALIDVAPPSLADTQGSAIAVAAADIDADGREEIYVVNSIGGAGQTANDRLFQWNPSVNQWIDLLQSKNRELAAAAPGRSLAVIDRRGNGRYGFLTTKYNGPLGLMEMSDSNNGVINVADSVGLHTPAATARSVLAVPLGLSPRPHVFVGVENGANMMFRTTEGSRFSDVTAVSATADSTHSARGIAVVQCYQCPSSANSLLAPQALIVGNSDGSSKLYIPSSPLLVPTQPLAMVNNASAFLAAVINIRNIVVADFDNDGLDEIFINSMGSPNVLLAFRDGQWVPVNAGEATEPTGHGTGAVAADVDGDGLLELIVSHGEISPGSLNVYRMAANDNYFMRIRPLTPAGAPARGARVTVRQRSRIQTKMIDAGSGYMCQQEPIAHFGLGACFPPIFGPNLFFLFFSLIVLCFEVPFLR